MAAQSRLWARSAGWGVPCPQPWHSVDVLTMENGPISIQGFHRKFPGAFMENLYGKSAVGQETLSEGKRGI
eukprot:360426-Chlamydomonas_euryale.AAC.7